MRALGVGVNPGLLPGLLPIFDNSVLYNDCNAQFTLFELQCLRQKRLYTKIPCIYVKM